MSDTIRLSNRLQTAADFVKPNARVADIGTDHAYLPAYLIMNGIASAAVASDLLEGPLKRAKATLDRYLPEGGVLLHLGNGLSGLEEFRPDTVMICGMGGELIASILTDAEWAWKPSVSFILQPMTRPETLRRFLFENGFAIEKERLARDDKLYTVLLVRYTGEKRYLPETEAVIGFSDPADSPELFLAYLDRLHDVYLVRQRGKEKAGIGHASEDGILIAIEEMKRKAEPYERCGILPETE
ncbi:MAG: class I SAM-dependent methyltransferase [Lachnospiraceae bacterium]|nr:class I SAM-dependent methyltransferase [Lachnospiraceae bacterium]